MTEEPARHNQPVSNQLHPLIFKIVVGLVLWFVLAAWASFDDNRYTGYLLVVVSGVFFIAIAIPTVLSRTARWAYGDEATRTSNLSFRDWLSGQFNTWQERRKAADAAVEIVLPIAAAAIGMTTLGLVFHLAAIHAV